MFSIVAQAGETSTVLLSGSNDARRACVSSRPDAIMVVSAQSSGMSFFVHAGMTCVMIGMPTGFVWHRASAVVFIIVLLFDFVVGPNAMPELARFRPCLVGRRAGAHSRSR